MFSMKSIRYVALSTLLTIGAFSAITYTSCNKDECKDVVCQNGGTCVDGTCTCTTGYEGTNCETAVRAKFIKTWTASDKVVATGTSIPAYSPIVTAGTSIVDIKISKFSDSYFTNEVKATVSGNTITIPVQEPDNDDYTVEGTGSYNATDKKITWTYTLKNPAGTAISYSGTWN
ncbi:hypothetical protein CAP35_14010 [Chitinophagaceae bacterium IBVUCB1]|nr:hypothetical protein CAP35_14010 [Chitinophagaceae bacterium IBVUCB1]